MKGNPSGPENVFLKKQKSNENKRTWRYKDVKKKLEEDEREALAERFPLSDRKTSHGPANRGPTIPPPHPIRLFRLPLRPDLFLLVSSSLSDCRQEIKNKQVTTSTTNVTTTDTALVPPPPRQYDVVSINCKTPPLALAEWTPDNFCRRSGQKRPDFPLADWKQTNLGRCSSSSSTKLLAFPLSKRKIKLFQDIRRAWAYNFPPPRLGTPFNFSGPFWVRVIKSQFKLAAVSPSSCTAIQQIGN